MTYKSNKEDKGLFSTVPAGGPPEEGVGAFTRAGEAGCFICEPEVRLADDGRPICWPG